MEKGKANYGIHCLLFRTTSHRDVPPPPIAETKRPAHRTHRSRRDGAQPRRPRRGALHPRLGLVVVVDTNINSNTGFHTDINTAARLVVRRPDRRRRGLAVFRRHGGGGRLLLHVHDEHASLVRTVGIDFETAPVGRSDGVTPTKTTTTTTTRPPNRTRKVDAPAKRGIIPPKPRHRLPRPPTPRPRPRPGHLPHLLLLLVLGLILILGVDIKVRTRIYHRRHGVAHLSQDQRAQAGRCRDRARVVGW